MHSSRYPRFLPALVVGYLVMLLTACDAGVSNSKIISPSPSPVATTVPVPPTRTDCPGSGTARAAVMPDLTLGSDTNIVYSISGYQANGQATSVMLKHYDVVT